MKHCVAKCRVLLFLLKVLTVPCGQHGHELEGVHVQVSPSRILRLEYSSCHQSAIDCYLVVVGGGVVFSLSSAL